MTNTTANMDESTTRVGLSREEIISYVFIIVGLGLLIYGGINLNNWRKISPQAQAEARVAKEEGLSRAEQSSLFERQFEAVEKAKTVVGRRVIIFVALGVVALWLSRQWKNWRVLYGEQMLYAYAFLFPPVGWILYLFAYQTRGDPVRKVIRRNIGIMSLALVAGGIAYLLVLLLQTYVLANLARSVEQGTALSGIVNFLISPQLAMIFGAVAGGYLTSLTKDVRAIGVGVQLVVLGIVIAILSWFGANAASGIEAQGLSVTDYTFLDLTSGFDISETLIDYDRSSTYGQAFLAGFLNTLMISIVGIFLASILGLFVGVARLSTNWLARTLSRVFVELMRNIPLLVLLFFLYAGVLLKLPQRANTIQILGGRILLNNRGVAMMWPRPSETFAQWWPFILVGLIAAGVVLYFRNKPKKITGRPAFSIWWVILAFVIVPAIGLFIVKPLVLEVPYIEGLNYARNQETGRWVGLVMSPEFFGILVGLVLYTGAFIGEIVRAGINSVSKGQREAATAIGLTQNQSLQLIILPQAMRVIVPPLTNQYLNLAKNSSLAIAIGYADLFFVANTTFNQSGQSVQVILMIMASYLLISLTISAIMNYINSRIQLKER